MPRMRWVVLCLGLAVVASPGTTWAQESPGEGHLALPSAKVVASNPVPMEIVLQVATAEARSKWGQVVAGQPIPCVDQDGQLAYYMVPFRLGTDPFPAYEQVMDGVKRGRALVADVERGELKPELMTVPPRNVAEGITLRSDPEQPVMKDKADTPESPEGRDQRAFKAARSVEMGIGQYGTVVVAATFDRYPIPLVTNYLPAFYYMGDLAEAKSKEILGGAATLSRIYFLGQRGIYFEFESEGNLATIHAFSLEHESIPRVARTAETPLHRQKVDAAWQEVARQGSDQVLVPGASLAEGDYRVMYWENIPCVFWTRGCTPTSASMVLGLWDPTDWGSGYIGYGKLTDYWRELSYKSDGSGGLVNVPNVLDQLRLAMETNVAGTTSTANIGPGIQWVTNALHGYAFTTEQTTCTSDNDYCWNADVHGITYEVDYGRPFVWSVGLADQVGHSLAAFGYTAAKQVIVYSTWTCPGEEYWYYSQYDNGSDYDWGFVDRVKPAGGVGSNTDLMTPNGGETWHTGGTYNIEWWDGDSGDYKFDLYYSTDGGVTWIYITNLTDLPGPGRSYSWTIPAGALATKARVRIESFKWNGSSYASHMGGDGSHRNFTITAGTRDLYVSSLSTPPPALLAGASFTVTDTTRNAGNIAVGASVTRYYLSLDSSKSASDILLSGSRNVPSLAAATANSGSVSVTIPAGTTPATYFLLACADDTGLVSENSEGNNCRSAYSLRVAERCTSFSISPTSVSPDYHASSQLVTIAGSSPAGCVGGNWLSTQGLWLTVSPSSGVGPGTTRVYWTQNGGVAPRSGTVTIAGNVFTANQGAGAPSDLVVASVTGPASAAASASISVSDTTKNQGTAAADASKTRFYLSSTPTWSGAALVMGPNYHSVPALAPGEVHTAATTVAVPAVPGGTYYIFAKADADAAIPETSETNNTRYAAIKIGPDLIVSAMKAPAAITPGGTMSVASTVKNQGAGAAPASVTGFYLSTNATLDASDTQVGAETVGPLAAGASLSTSSVLKVPATLGPGTYYVIAKADNGTLIPEPLETNNTRAVATNVLPDLVVSALTAPVTFSLGATINVSNTVTNSGGVPAAASVAGIYLSTNSTWDLADQLLATRAVPALAAGASSADVTAVTMPHILLSGSYYIICKADPANAVAEVSETNNTKYVVTKVLPDLVISLLTTAAGAPGEPVTLNEQTKNQGTVTAAASTTSYYLSTNTAWDVADTLLLSRDVGELAAGAISTASPVAMIPAGVAPGSYYIIAKADSGAAVTEASETNNTKYAAIKIGPDLIVSALTVPSQVSPGRTYPVTATVKNQGAGAVGENTVLRFYLSTDPAYSPLTDVVIGAGSVRPLAAGATFTYATTTPPMPSMPVNVTYYIIAVADAASAVPESVETNNTMLRTTIRPY